MENAHSAIQDIYVQLSDDPNLCEESKLIPSLNFSYNYLTPIIQYELCYYGNHFRFMKMAFYSKSEKKLLALCPMTLSMDGKLSYFQLPFQLFVAENAALSFTLIHALYTEFEKSLMALVADKNVSTLIFSNDSRLQKLFFPHTPKAIIQNQAVVNLNQPEELIKLQMRKSYRSLINWGQRTLRHVRVDHLHPEYNSFEEFRQFHIRVAGRETRPKITWDKQFECIQMGHAFLDLAYLDSKLVSGALIMLGTSEAYYAVAVNDRELMAQKMAIGHSLIHGAIVHSKSLGKTQFVLGNIGPFENPKENHIGLFKAGFTSEVSSQLYFQVDFKQSHDLRVE